MQLDLSFFGVFIMVLMAVGSFLLGRWLSRHWRRSWGCWKAES